MGRRNVCDPAIYCVRTLIRPSCAAQKDAHALIGGVTFYDCFFFCIVNILLSMGATRVAGLGYRVSTHLIGSLINFCVCVFV